MPYILQEDRQKFKEAIQQALDSFGQDWTAGEFNYFVSTIVVNLFERNKRYQTANDILGALDGVSKEFYRLQVAEYEDAKCAYNGGVEMFKTKEC